MSEFKENEKCRIKTIENDHGGTDVSNICDCCGCKYHDDFSWVCCNGDSPHRADFVNCGCEYKNIEKVSRGGA